MVANTLGMHYMSSHPNQYLSSLYGNEKKLKNPKSFSSTNDNDKPVMSTLIGAGATLALNLLSHIPVFHNEYSKSLENTLYRNEIIANSLSVNITPFEAIENESMKYINGQLARISGFTSGWNGRESIGASHQTIDEVREFSNLLFVQNVKLPIVSLADDGEINFYWNFDGKILDLGFFGDGFYSYYFKDGEGRELFADDKPIKEIICDEVVEFLKI